MDRPPHANRPGDIIMAGPHPDAPGGISTVMRTWQEAGLARQWPTRTLATWVTGSSLRRAARAAAAAAELGMRLRAGRVQALHLHVAGRGSFWRKAALAAMARRARIPVLLHLHDGTFIAWWQSQPPWAQHLIRSELQSAQAVIALDEDWRARYAERAPGSRLAVLPNPVWVSARPPSPQLGRVLFLSRLWADKGLHELMQAAALLRERHPALRLELAGDGDVEAVRAQAHRMSLGDRVDLPGWLEGDRKQQALERAQILVLPSWAEGQPLAVLEAMAAGVPVLATAVGGLPRLLAHGGGVLVPPRDAHALAQALDGLLSQPERCRTLGAAGQQRALRHHEAGAVVRSLGTLYRTLGLQALHGDSN